MVNVVRVIEKLSVCTVEQMLDPTLLFAASFPFHCLIQEARVLERSGLMPFAASDNLQQTVKSLSHDARRLNIRCCSLIDPTR